MRHWYTTHHALIHRLSGRLNSHPSYIGHPSYIDASTVATEETPHTTRGLGQEERQLTDDVNVDALSHSITLHPVVGLTDIQVFINSCVLNVSDS